MRTAQFISDRLLLERREDRLSFELIDVKPPRISIVIYKSDIDEIQRIIDRNFEMYTREEKQDIDDDIPF